VRQAVRGAAVLCGAGDGWLCYINGMSLQRRTGPAPYEIMAGKPAGAQSGQQREASGDAPTRDVREPSADVPYGDWRDIGGRPLALRVPRGYVVVAAVALLSGLMIAYAVGHARGYRGGFSEGQTSAAKPPSPLTASFNASASTAPQTAPPGAPPTAPPANVSRVPGIPADPRFFVVARYPRKEAQRLTTFLIRNGVEAQVISTDNANLFLVADRLAFDKQDVQQRSPAFEERRSKLKQLGRLWKEKEKGPTDLADLQPQALPTR
jgi:hypothetical protein